MCNVAGSHTRLSGKCAHTWMCVSTVTLCDFCVSHLSQVSRVLCLQDISKRLSLPPDMRLPERFLVKQSLSPTLNGPGPINRRLRRASLVGDVQMGNLLRRISENVIYVNGLTLGDCNGITSQVQRLTSIVLC